MQYGGNFIEGSNPSLSAKLHETNLRFFSSRRQNGIHFVGLLFSLIIESGVGVWVAEVVEV
jgi:hypothetical protein